MNAITTYSSKSLGPVTDRRSSDDLAAVRNRMIRDYPAAPEILLEPIPSETRGRLECRRSELERWLAPAAKFEHPTLAKAIAGMLGAFAAGSSGSAEATVAKYLHVVEDLPAWAVARACLMLERGEVDGASLDFRPSAPRLRDAARSLMAPWLEEFFLIRKVLTAPVLEPEDAAMRQRIGRMLTDLASDMRSGKLREPAA